MSWQYDFHFICLPFPFLLLYWVMWLSLSQDITWFDHMTWSHDGHMILSHDNHMTIPHSYIMTLHDSYTNTSHMSHSDSTVCFTFPIIPTGVPMTPDDSVRGLFLDWQWHITSRPNLYISQALWVPCSPSVKFLTGNLCATCARVSVGTGGSVGGHLVRQDPLCEEQGRAGRWERREGQGFEIVRR